MILGLPPVSFVIMFIIWPAIPIAAIVIALVQKSKEDKEAKKAEKNQ